MPKLAIVPKRYDPATGNLVKIPADLNITLNEMLLESVRRFPRVMQALADQAEAGNARAAGIYAGIVGNLVLKLTSSSQQKSLLDAGAVDDAIREARTDILMQIREEVRSALADRTELAPDEAPPTHDPASEPPPG